MSADLPNIPTAMLVVAGALERPDGALLMQQRPAGKAHAGLWEFPGGKVESGEIPRLALARELAEELGIALDPRDAEPLAFAESVPQTGEQAIVILLYRLRAWRGEPAALEGGALGWFRPAEIAELPLPPLDRELLACL